ncbi:MAG TPA: hypothetical protein VM100_09775 [Longimicrobiales bacterium]|nr:hypothetical protein [Longimicrobiales bacterium]
MRTRFLIPILAVLATAMPAPAQTTAPAQVKLPVGQWTGTVTPPDGQTVSVTYDVTSKNDTTKLTINAGQHGSFEATGIKFDGTTISFSFSPGPQVNCTLKKQEDGSFSGQCLDDGGTGAAMVMAPPKKAETK